MAVNHPCHPESKTRPTQKFPFGPIFFFWWKLKCLQTDVLAQLWLSGVIGISPDNSCPALLPVGDTVWFGLMFASLETRMLCCKSAHTRSPMPMEDAGATAEDFPRCAKAGKCRAPAVQVCVLAQITQGAAKSWWQQWQQTEETSPNWKVSLVLCSSLCRNKICCRFCKYH